MIAYPQRPQYFDGANPLSKGRITYMEVGTGSDILKPVYADPDFAIALPNPLILDQNGMVPESSVFYGVGNYRVRVERCLNPDSPTPVYQELYTVPEVEGATASSGSSGVTFFVATIAELQAQATANANMAYVAGYYSAYDGGGGWFKWSSASVAPSDFGAVIVATDAPAVGRWIRIFNGLQADVRFWGAIGNSSSRSANILNAHQFAVANGLNTILSGADCGIGSDVVLEGGSVVVNPAFSIVGVGGSATLIINSDNAEFLTKKKIVGTNSALIVSPLVLGDLLPEWWGADPTGTNNSLNAFKLASNSNGRLVISGNYKLTNAGAVEIITIKSLYLQKDGFIYLPNAGDAIKLIVQYADSDEYAEFALNYQTSTQMELQCDVKARWFFSATANTTQLSVLFGSVKGTIVWDKDASISAFIAPSGTIQNYVERGNLLTITGNVFFGSMSAGNYQIFSGTGSPYFTNASNPYWFGAVANTTTLSVTTASAINKAVSCAIISGGVVDLQGLDWYCGALLLFQSANIGDVVRLRNGNLLETSSNSASNFIRTEVACDFSRVGIYSTRASIIAFNNDTKNTSTNGSTFVSCNFSGAYPYIGNTLTSTSFSSCAFNLTDSTLNSEFKGTSNFSLCNFVASSAYTVNNVGLKATGSCFFASCNISVNTDVYAVGSFIGCVFTNAQLVYRFSAQSVIANCTFLSGVNANNVRARVIYYPATSTAINGLIFKDSQFVNTSGGNFDTFEWFNAPAYGNNCTIENITATGLTKDRICLTEFYCDNAGARPYKKGPIFYDNSGSPIELYAELKSGGVYVNDLVFTSSVNASN